MCFGYSVRISPNIAGLEKTTSYIRKFTVVSQHIVSYSFPAEGCNFSFVTFKTKSEHCCELTQTESSLKVLPHPHRPLLLLLSVSSSFCCHTFLSVPKGSASFASVYQQMLMLDLTCDLEKVFFFLM